MSGSVKEKEVKLVNKNNVYHIGVVTIIGSQFGLWNSGLSSGFFNFFISVIIVGSGYICLSLCLAEITSSVSFSGGNYSLARITINKFSGFLIAACETIQYIYCVAVAASNFGSTLTELTGHSSSNEPLYWLGFYAACIIVNLSHSTTHQRLNLMALMSVAILILIVIYCVLVPVDSHFQQYSRTEPSFDGSERERSIGYFHALPYAAWFFIGLETIQQSSTEVPAINRALVPKAILTLMVVSICTCFGILFSSSSIHPGIAELSLSQVPLSYGYASVFNISRQLGMIFQLFAQFCFGSGFMFAASRHMRAAEKSKLMLVSVERAMTPFRAKFRMLLIVSIIGYVNILGIWYWNKSFIANLENVCLLAAFCSYIGVFCSYIVFRTKFSSLCQNYRSVLDVYGAYYGIIVFTLAFIGAVGFQDDHGWSIGLFLIYMLIYVCMYVFQYRHVEIYSTDEQAVFFIAYVVKANMERRVRQIAAREQKMKMALLAKLEEKRLDHSGGIDSSSVVAHKDSISLKSSVDGTAGSTEQTSVRRHLPSNDDTAMHHAAPLVNNNVEEGHQVVVRDQHTDARSDKYTKLNTNNDQVMLTDSTKQSASVLSRLVTSVATKYMVPVNGTTNASSSSSSSTKPTQQQQEQHSTTTHKVSRIARNMKKRVTDFREHDGSDSDSGERRLAMQCTVEDNQYIAELYNVIMQRYKEAAENPFYKDSGLL